jgi:putative membrane protein
VFIALGIASAVRAWFWWMAAESALRRHAALPAPSLGLAMVIGLVTAVLLVAVGSIV